MTKKENQSQSGLFYFGSQDEVQLGDQVCIKRWLRKNFPGTVCYIPTISLPHRDIGIHRWAIRLESGRLMLFIYDPPHPKAQPPKWIKLIRRGDQGLLYPEEKFPESDDYISDDM